MPIFTFMGANIMRLDDAYSFRVIDKTVQMVIPALIKVRLRQRGLTRTLWLTQSGVKDGFHFRVLSDKDTELIAVWFISCVLVRNFDL